MAVGVGGDAADDLLDDLEDGDDACAAADGGGPSEWVDSNTVSF